MRIQYTFTQRYDNWSNPIFVEEFDARVATFEILEHMDNLEAKVYKDRDFLLANEMLDAIRRK
jgi:hypothetical protein